MLQNSDIEGLYFVNETLDVGKYNIPKRKWHYGV